jgi:hypothetical protein
MKASVPAISVKIQKGIDTDIFRPTKAVSHNTIQGT